MRKVNIRLSGIPPFPKTFAFIESLFPAFPKMDSFGGIQVQTIPFERGSVPNAKFSALGSRSRGGRGNGLRQGCAERLKDVEEIIMAEIDARAAAMGADVKRIMGV